MKLSVVIPALNEEHGIGDVLREIPIAQLGDMGYAVEVIVVDNGSKDKTARVACMQGATVVMQPSRGYGNAYKAGFAYATGDVIATGDADLTYPFADLPNILEQMGRGKLDFITTDRLSGLRRGAMTQSHIFGNWLLTFVAKVLFGWPYKDSQSGMWVFKRCVWDALDVQSSGMPFSQELKIEAFVRGFRCAEVPIVYRARAGKAKLNTITDGLGNVTQLVSKRISLGSILARSTALGEEVSNGRGAPAHDGAPGSPVIDITDLVWDERWYDFRVPADGATREHVLDTPPPTLDEVAMDGSCAGEPIRLVVWRAERRRRPRVEWASVNAIPD